MQKDRLEQLTNDAIQLEKKYEWLQAAAIYKKASNVAIEGNDLFKAAKIHEKMGFCFYRAALQAINNTQFKKRMKEAIQTYKKANNLFQKCKNEEASIEAVDALAKIAYCKSWLEYDFSKKQDSAQEWWTLKFKVLKAYGKAKDQFGIAKTINDILENSSVNIDELRSSNEDRRGFSEKFLSLGEQAITILSKIGDVYELARAYCWTNWHYGMALFSNTHKMNELPEHLKLFSKKALELSKKTKNAWLIGWANNASNLVTIAVGGDTTAQLAFLRNQIKQARIAKDNHQLGVGQMLLAIYGFTTVFIVEDPDKNRKFHEKNVKLAKESIKHSQIFNIRKWNANYYTGLAILGLASIEMDVNVKRKLLLEAVKYARKGAEYSKDWEFGSIGAKNCLNMALYQISEVEPNTIQKRSYLEEVLNNAKLNLRLLEEYPTNYFFKAYYQNWMALAAYSLSKMESDKEKKIHLLNVAISAIEKCVKNTKTDLKTSTPEFVYGRFGDFYYKFGEIYYDLYSHTKEKSLLSKTLDIYIDTINLYDKIDRFTGIAECYWQKAIINDQLGEQIEAAKDYKLASEAYNKAAKKIPPLREFYSNLSSYMQAWSQIEQARYNHSVEDYEKAKQNYKNSAELHESTDHWSYLASNYFAWGNIEEAEGLSRKEETQKAKQTFQKALQQFTQAEKSIKQKIGEITSPEEKAMIQKLLQSSSLRRRFCQVRIKIEEAKLLDRQAKYLQSSRSYGRAAQELKTIIEQTELEAENKELELLEILCRAWEKMALAEETTSSESYLEAAELFEQAKELCYTKKGSLWALGNSNFCRGLAAGAEYQTMLDLEDHNRAKGYIQNAATNYLKAGYKNASEYAKATSRLFDAYLFMNQAEREPDPEKRAKQYQLAENLLQLSSASFIESQQPEKTAQVKQILENVREEKKLAISFNQVLQAPSIASTTQSFTAPSPTSEVSVGLESFEHANVQANLIVGLKEVKVGESFCLTVEFVNAGKESALLTRVEDFVPQDFVVVNKPEIYRLEKSCLNMKGKQIAPLKLVEVKVVLQPSKKGIYQLSPRVHYLDELGKNKAIQLKAIEIKVLEIVLADRESTGTKELDHLLLGGIPKEYAVVLTGPPNDERELIIRNFLEVGTKKSQTSFFVTTEVVGLVNLLKKSGFYLFLCNPKPKTEVPDLPNVYKLHGKTDLTNLNIALLKVYRNVEQSLSKRICVNIVSDVLVDYGLKATRKWIAELTTDLVSKDFTVLAVINPLMHTSEELYSILDLFDGEINLIQTEDPLECKKSLRIKKLRNQDYIKNPICLT